jgi:hypothetical protein
LHCLPKFNRKQTAEKTAETEDPQFPQPELRFFISETRNNNTRRRNPNKKLANVMIQAKHIG